ncbi:CapA family protein [Coprobacter tertius]|uniref:CapA family protein n=1 Tax=Coprobacter tertius TaxID=2944915 RepID=A0ABT1MF51_9BACT|nr:CapA family protein [Coprobacter tertius]MCP9611248.1 CapA family protein [Coprobacter tertius]
MKTHLINKRSLVILRYLSEVFLFIIISLYACTSNSQEKHNHRYGERSFNYESRSDTLTLLFVGDAMQHLPQVTNAKIEGGFDYDACFDKIRNEVRSVDIAVVNFETTLGGKPYSGYPQFSSPREYAAALKNAGFGIFLTANNHCLDRYTKGLNRTIAALDTLGITHLGTYTDSVSRVHEYPLIIDKNNIRMAFFNYTYGTNGIGVILPSVVNYIDTVQIKADLETAKMKGAELMIACIHWGEEYHKKPTYFQKQIATFLRREGVQLIIGAHPHVIQPMSLKKDSIGASCLIVYSLGNFISNMQDPDTQGGAIVKVKVIKNDHGIDISDARYALHYTQRPAHRAGKGYEVLPAASVLPFVKDSFPLLYIPMKRFVENNRHFLQENNYGVEEYIF